MKLLFQLIMILDRRDPDWASVRPSAGSCTLVTISHSALQSWSSVAGKLCTGKGSGGIGQQWAEHEPAVAQMAKRASDILAYIRNSVAIKTGGNNFSSLLGTGSASP